MSGRGRGSLTIFSALSIMLVASMIFALLEAARVSEVKRMAEEISDSAVESVFAGYDRLMWEQYHLLVYMADSGGALSFAEAEEELAGLAAEMTDAPAQSMFMTKTNLFCGETESAEVESYRLITDDKGRVFERAVASYRKAQLPNQLIDALKGEMDQLASLKEGDPDAAVSDAQKTLADASASAEDAPDGGTKAAEAQSAEAQGAPKENPLTFYAGLRKKGLLHLLVEDSGSISEKELQKKELFSSRSHSTGTMPAVSAGDWSRRLLVAGYYGDTFGCYIAPKDGEALSYEQEYLIAGKQSDLKNLKSCVNRLLLIRETANLAALGQDAGRQSQAMAAAEAIAGMSLNPAVIEAVKDGILAAWAYVESLLDLRALLAGRRIALVKTSEQWTSDLYHLGDCLSHSFMAEDCGNGPDYSRYLLFLLYLKEGKRMAYRAMNLMELSIRQKEGYAQFRMDHLVSALQAEIRYRFPYRFARLAVIGQSPGSGFRYHATAEYSYEKAGV